MIQRLAAPGCDLLNSCGILRDVLFSHVASACCVRLCEINNSVICSSKAVVYLIVRPSKDKICFMCDT